MSGLELQSWLVAHGLLVPVIFMTAFPETTTRAQALAAGAHGYLSKPYRAQSLIDYVVSALATGG
jgi:FixJ family two-component response regulator